MRGRHSMAVQEDHVELQKLLSDENSSDGLGSESRSTRDRSLRAGGKGKQDARQSAKGYIASFIPIYAGAILLAYVFGAYVFGSSRAFLPEPLSRARNILFATGHPDDLELFFTPATVSLLERSGVQARGHLLVLSAGNNYGYGNIRKQEQQSACGALGLAECVVLDIPAIQDNPKYWWPAADILAQLKPYVTQWDIDAIVTFDNGGVSNHINHRAVSAAVREWTQEPNSSAPIAYTLHTVSLLRKYAGLLDLPLTTLPYLWRGLFRTNSRAMHGLLVAPIQTYFTVWRAFSHHKSQFTWDRYFYLIFSRYCYVNQLDQVQKD